MATKDEEPFVVLRAQTWNVLTWIDFSQPTCKREVSPVQSSQRAAIALIAEAP